MTQVDCTYNSFFSLHSINIELLLLLWCIVHDVVSILQSSVMNNIWCIVICSLDCIMYQETHDVSMR